MKTFLISMQVMKYLVNAIDIFDVDFFSRVVQKQIPQPFSFFVSHVQVLALRRTYYHH